MLIPKRAHISGTFGDGLESEFVDASIKRQ